jgi:hypothetical protein
MIKNSDIVPWSMLTCRSGWSMMMTLSSGTCNTSVFIVHWFYLRFEFV